jgi:hypothetical protein
MKNDCNVNADDLKFGNSNQNFHPSPGLNSHKIKGLYTVDDIIDLA